MKKIENKIIKALLNPKSENYDFYFSNFVNYIEKPIGLIPISPYGMKPVCPRASIFVKEEVYLELLRLKTVTDNTSLTYNYLIFGQVLENGTIIFEKILTDFKFVNEKEAGIENMFLELLKFKDNRKPNQAICIGKTHKNTDISDNFYMEDFITYLKMNEVLSANSLSDIKTLVMLINSSGDFNFAGYDDNEFYRYNTVYLRFDNGDLDYLPAYRNGNYIKKETSKKTITK